MNSPAPANAPHATEVQWAIGVDVGGTNIRAGLVMFPAGELHERRMVPSNPERGGEAVLGTVLELSEELAGLAGGRSSRPVAIGIVLCELVDLDGNAVSANCIDWRGISIRENFSHVAPAFLEADVRAAGVAEAEFGAGRSFRQFLYVTVGTGISSCLMLDGQPFGGAHGLTGTMASSSISVPCEQCGSVAGRTLEELASGPGLVARLNRVRSAGLEPVQSGEAVLAMAASGDADAMRIVQSGAEALGAMIGMLVSTLDPEGVVIGGGLGTSGGLYWSGLVASVRKHTWSELQRSIPVVQAATGANAGVIGAAALARKRALGRR